MANQRLKNPGPSGLPGAATTLAHHPTGTAPDLINKPEGWPARLQQHGLTWERCVNPKTIKIWRKGHHDGVDWVTSVTTLTNISYAQELSSSLWERGATGDAKLLREYVLGQFGFIIAIKAVAGNFKDGYTLEVLKWSSKQLTPLINVEVSYIPKHWQDLFPNEIFTLDLLKKVVSIDVLLEEGCFKYNKNDKHSYIVYQGRQSNWDDGETPKHTGGLICTKKSEPAKKYHVLTDTQLRDYLYPKSDKLTHYTITEVVKQRLQNIEPLIKQANRAKAEADKAKLAETSHHGPSRYPISQ